MCSPNGCNIFRKELCVGHDHENAEQSLQERCMTVTTSPPDGGRYNFTASQDDLVPDGSNNHSQTNSGILNVTSVATTSVPEGNSSLISDATLEKEEDNGLSSNDTSSDSTEMPKATSPKEDTSTAHSSAFRFHLPSLYGFMFIAFTL